MNAAAFSPGANGDVGVGACTVEAAFQMSEFFRPGSFDYDTAFQGITTEVAFDELCSATLALERTELEVGIQFTHSRHVLLEALRDMQQRCDPSMRFGKLDLSEVATEKIMLPMNPPKGVNYIGRIVGPRGISVRNLEAAFQVSIRIRGKGSVKDSHVETMLLGKPGYEHLDEALHVRIDAIGPRCQDRVRQCSEVISNLLTPDFDEYKRAQLQQLAVINGTYRPYKG